MKRSIKTKLSAAILIIVLLTISMISFLSNYFINQQFTSYIARQQELRAQVIQSTLSQQYNKSTKQWNNEYIDSIGMFSLYEGYIIKVYDNENKILWDAQAHDMSLCNQIMNEISNRMKIKYPQINGEFISTVYHLDQDNVTIGSVSISFFGPFFLNDNEFQFLEALNTILISIGLISLLISLIVGHILAKRISNPILKTVEATKEIADGNYMIRLESETNTIELDMLVDSVNHLATTLETLEKLRKQLTQDVAHELRTPITILQSHIEAILEGIWEPTTERLQSCYDETIRIGKLVSDLENLAKIEDNNFNLDKSVFNLTELINKIVNNFEAELNNKNLKINIEGSDLFIYADQDRMSQVLVNLLSNAVKYSKDGGKIQIELLDYENSVGFRIQDDGIGIPENELSFIFERFYRADKSRNRLTGGSGIGLTIVKSIVEAHGGRIYVDSQIDEGSQFTVVLPKAQT